MVVNFKNPIVMKVTWKGNQIIIYMYTEETKYSGLLYFFFLVVFFKNIIKGIKWIENSW